MTNIIMQNVTNFTIPVHDGEDHDDESNKGMIIAKATAMTVLFLASTFFGLLPFNLARWFQWKSSGRNSSLVIALLLGFGGGVLLATTFLHLLPEVGENIRALQAKGKIPELKFHLAEFLMCAGFFAMYFVEEIVHMYLSRREMKLEKTTNAFRRGVSIRESDIKDHKEPELNGNHFISTVELTTTATEATTTNGFHEHRPGTHFHEHNHGPGYHTHLPVDLEDNIVSSLRGLLIVLALSVHELFEGLAVGLENTESEVWYMFGAVAAHKLVLAFCVGVELVVNRTKFVLTLIYVITFAIVSPIGIGIGMMLSENGDATELPSAILQGLATGTLLYVVFFEILSKTARSDLRQYVVILLGFCVMFGLQFATGHQHSHGGDHEDEDDHDHHHAHAHHHSHDHIH